MSPKIIDLRVQPDDRVAAPSLTYSFGTIHETSLGADEPKDRVPICHPNPIKPSIIFATSLPWSVKMLASFSSVF